MDHSIARDRAQNEPTVRSASNRGRGEAVGAHDGASHDVPQIAQRRLLSRWAGPLVALIGRPAIRIEHLRSARDHLAGGVAILGGNDDHRSAAQPLGEERFV